MLVLLIVGTIPADCSRQVLWKFSQNFYSVIVWIIFAVLPHVNVMVTNLLDLYTVAARRNIVLTPAFLSHPFFASLYRCHSYCFMQLYLLVHFSILFTTPLLFHTYNWIMWYSSRYGPCLKLYLPLTLRHKHLIQMPSKSTSHTFHITTWVVCFPSTSTNFRNPVKKIWRQTLEDMTWNSENFTHKIWI